ARFTNRSVWKSRPAVCRFSSPGITPPTFPAPRSSIMLTRRHLLQLSASTALGAALASPVSAAEPISGRTKPKFKYSLAAYSYRGLLTAKDSEFTLSDFLKDCADFQLEGTELTSYYF